MAHKGIEDIWENVIKKGKTLVEDATHMNMLVHHEGVGAHVGDLHDKMQDAMNPSEVVEEENSAGNGSEDVKQKMC